MRRRENGRTLWRCPPSILIVVLPYCNHSFTLPRLYILHLKCWYLVPFTLVRHPHPSSPSLLRTSPYQHPSATESPDSLEGKATARNAWSCIWVGILQLAFPPTHPGFLRIMPSGPRTWLYTLFAVSSFISCIHAFYIPGTLLAGTISYQC